MYACQAEDMARTVVVVWRPTPECNCPWGELFEPHPNLHVTDGSRPPVPPGASTIEVCQPIEALVQWRHVAQVRHYPGGRRGRRGGLVSSFALLPLMFCWALNPSPKP